MGGVLDAVEIDGVERTTRGALTVEMGVRDTTVALAAAEMLGAADGVDEVDCLGVGLNGGKSAGLGVAGRVGTGVGVTSSGVVPEFAVPGG